jgi:hypothetical protein
VPPGESVAGISSLIANRIAKALNALILSPACCTATPRHADSCVQSVAQAGHRRTHGHLPLRVRVLRAPICGQRLALAGRLVPPRLTSLMWGATHTLTCYPLHMRCRYIGTGTATNFSSLQIPGGYGQIPHLPSPTFPSNRTHAVVPDTHPFSPVHVAADIQLLCLTARTPCQEA